MTARGFCVVAALSSQTNGRPLTRSSRIGKSRRTRSTSNGRCPASGPFGRHALDCRHVAAVPPRALFRIVACGLHVRASGVRGSP